MPLTGVRKSLPGLGYSTVVCWHSQGPGFHIQHQQKKDRKKRRHRLPNGAPGCSSLPREEGELSLSISVPWPHTAVLLCPASGENFDQKSQSVVSQLPGMTRCCKDTKLMLTPLHIGGVRNLNLGQPTSFCKHPLPPPSSDTLPSAEMLSAPPEEPVD